MAFSRNLTSSKFAFFLSLRYNYHEVKHMDQSIANQLIKNLERENELLQKRCSTLEKAVQKSELVILEQNEIIHELQNLCDKQQKFIDDMTGNNPD